VLISKSFSEKAAAEKFMNMEDDEKSIISEPARAFMYASGFSYKN